MQVSPSTTVAELMQKYPNGFAVGPGTPDNPGELSRVLAASSHFQALLLAGLPEENQGYLLVDMDDATNAKLTCKPLSEEL